MTCTEEKLSYQKTYYEQNKAACNANSRAWAIAHPQEMALMRARWRMKNYGISLEEYEELLTSQDRGCAICGILSPGGTKIWFCVDHDHSCCPGKSSCGKCVRGLLCDSCNTGIGRFTDDPEKLDKAAIYLRNHNA